MESWSALARRLGISRNTLLDWYKKVFHEPITGNPATPERVHAIEIYHADLGNEKTA